MVQNNNLHDNGNHMQYDDFFALANKYFGNVIDIINAWNDGNISYSFDLMENLFPQMKNDNFFDYQLFSDVLNNGIDLTSYGISDSHDMNDVIWVPMNDNELQTLHDLVLNDNYFNGDLAKSHFCYGSNSIIYLLFGYNLGKQLINFNGGILKLMGAN